MRLLVVPDIADTTTTIFLFFLYWAATLLATFLMQSISATEVPPNFITIIDIYESYII